jgi:hypothetical protein
VTVTETEDVAGVVPIAPVAVKLKSVVPTAFRVNCVPVEFSELASTGTDVPF